MLVSDNYKLYYDCYCTSNQHLYYVTQFPCLISDWNDSVLVSWQVWLSQYDTVCILDMVSAISRADLSLPILCHRSFPTPHPLGTTTVPSVIMSLPFPDSRYKWHHKVTVFILKWQDVISHDRILLLSFLSLAIHELASTQIVSRSGYFE